MRTNILKYAAAKIISLFIFLFIVFAVGSMDAYAEEKAPLGIGNVAVKLDYIVFTDDYWSDSNTEDDGLYIGLEGYGEITPNVYIGGEIGTAANITVFGNDIQYVPVELNIKYAMAADQNFVLDFGAGASYNYAELTIERIGGPDIEEDDWLFGGQFFAGVAFKINWFFIGADAKYQITEDFKDSDFDFSNWRLGGKVGVVF